MQFYLHTELSGQVKALPTLTNYKAKWEYYFVECLLMIYNVLIGEVNQIQLLLQSFDEVIANGRYKKKIEYVS